MIWKVWALEPGDSWRTHFNKYPEISFLVYKKGLHRTLAGISLLKSLGMIAQWKMIKTHKNLYNSFKQKHCFLLLFHPKHQKTRETYVFSLEASSIKVPSWRLPFKNLKNLFLRFLDDKCQKPKDCQVFGQDRPTSRNCGPLVRWAQGQSWKLVFCIYIYYLLNKNKHWPSWTPHCFLIVEIMS